MITIRSATEQDTEAVAAVLQAAARWQAACGTPMWNVDDLAAGKILPEIRDFYLAFSERLTAGVMKFVDEDPLFWPEIPRGESAFIHRLAVHRAFAGGGLAKALLDFAVQEAKARGKKILRLDCAADRPKLRRIYEAYGFVHHSDFVAPPYRVARYELFIPSRA